MNRRGFLRSLFVSTAAIVVAPAYVLDELGPHRTYFDMGRVPPGHIVLDFGGERIVLAPGDSASFSYTWDVVTLPRGWALVR